MSLPQGLRPRPMAPPTHTPCCPPPSSMPRCALLHPHTLARCSPAIVPPPGTLCTCPPAHQPKPPIASECLRLPPAVRHRRCPGCPGGVLGTQRCVRHPSTTQPTLTPHATHSASISSPPPYTPLQLELLQSLSKHQPHQRSLGATRAALRAALPRSRLHYEFWGVVGVVHSCREGLDRQKGLTAGRIWSRLR